MVYTLAWKQQYTRQGSNNIYKAVKIYKETMNHSGIYNGSEIVKQ